MYRAYAERCSLRALKGGHAGQYRTLAKYQRQHSQTPLSSGALPVTVSPLVLMPIHGATLL